MTFCPIMLANAARHRSSSEAEIMLMKMEMETKVAMMQMHSRLAPKARGKCPGCGSHEFRKHYLRTICSYCRVEV